MIFFVLFQKHLKWKKKSPKNAFQMKIKSKDTFDEANLENRILKYIYVSPLSVKQSQKATFRSVSFC